MTYPPIPVAAGGRLRPLRPSRDRAERPRRVRVRLWLPVSLLVVLLAPLAVVALPILAAVMKRRRIRPARTLLAAAQVLFALGGTLVEVEAPHASVRIRLF